MGKAQCEYADLDHFFGAYRHVTGERLTYEGGGDDPPDFLCGRQDGTLVGVELTMIMHNYGGSPWSRLRSVFDAGNFMDPHEAASRMFDAAAAKAEKIHCHAPAWLPRTILVLQLMEAEGERVARHLVYEDFEDLGFAEIWAADWTGIEAYGNVELIGVLPEKWRGYHRNGWRSKPYG